MLYTKPVRERRGTTTPSMIGRRPGADLPSHLARLCVCVYIYMPATLNGTHNSRFINLLFLLYFPSLPRPSRRQDMIRPRGRTSDLLLPFFLYSLLLLASFGF